MDSTPQPPQGSPSRSRRPRRLAALIALPLTALLLSGCTVPSFGAKKSDTVTGRSTYQLWQGFSIAAAVIGGFVILLIVIAVIRFRAKGATIPRQSQYHLPLEIAYTISPIVMVFVLFGYTVVVENKVVAEPATPYQVSINAFQWGWKFSYPGTNALIVGHTNQNPMMLIPVGVPVHYTLTSTDANHGFYVRDFNFSRLAIPGIKNEFSFQAIDTGTFNGQCTELCGLYHSLMYFRVKVVTLPEFLAWEKKFDTPAGAAAAQAANLVVEQETSSIIPTKPTGTTGTKI